MLIDLRSDTISMPDKPMLETILHASLGDDGRTNENNRGEDVTVNELEDMVAHILGKEAALLVPSGTMGNSCGVLSWCKPGDKVIVHKSQHLFVSEKVLFDPLFFNLQAITYDFDDNMCPDVYEINRLAVTASAKLLCIENTHNNSGGFCIPIEKLKELRAVADKNNLPIHMDGARLFHAAAALNVSAYELAAYADTVMVCLSKGLGAPIGSVLCGSKKQIDKAREIRKYLGGGMRQAGIIAAPGIYALQHNLSILKYDINNAGMVADRIRKNVSKIKVQETIPSNIVMLDLSEANVEAQAFCRMAKKKGLLIGQVLDTPVVRMVFYKDISAEQASLAADIIIEIDKNL